MADLEPSSPPPVWHFRPHHLMCWQTYRGKGYSPDFVQNFDALKAAWDAGKRPRIHLAVSADVICQPCPHRQGESCRFADSVAARDRAVLAATGFPEGAVMPLDEALDLVAPRFLDIQETACAGCEWRPFCRDAYLAGPNGRPEGAAG